MSQKVFNFSAGPGILPQEVFEKVSKACLKFGSNSLSILEMSHRSKPILEMVDQATEIVKEILAIPAGYEVIFLQGGASQQFCMVPYNLLDEDGVGAYVDSGVWAKKAFKEAQILSKSIAVASSKDQNYSFIPKKMSIPENAGYLHITSNNTIYGTQYKQFPKDLNTSLVVDMSSDILSRSIRIQDFDLIYAGAQKNMGSAGATLVIVREEILGKTNRSIPTILDYRAHIKNKSMLNTPPVFAIYVVLETLLWLKAQGGICVIEKKNIEKAKILYQEIDSNPLFKNEIAKEDRSLMNVTFMLEDTSLDTSFFEFASQQGINGIKGHRSTGGFRASIYNAMPLSGVERLIEVMQDFKL